MIHHISDTAHWIAYYRALETERPDALFKDPFSKKLTQSLREDIARTLPRGIDAGWSMIVRTAVIDEFVTKTVREKNVDVVVNVAAGLDTRPYRLDLPNSLLWIDFDLPEILQFKNKSLEGENLRCRYEVVELD